MQAPRFKSNSIALILVVVLVLCAPSATVSADPGDRDPLFGDNGRVATDFFGRVDVAASAAIQPDGKVVVVGNSAHTADDSSLDFSLARYNTDGTLDPEFGDGGKVATDFAGDQDEAESVAIQPDGRIVVVGYVVRSTTGYDFGVARYLPDGTLDPEFGDGGKVATDFARNDDVATAMALLPDGGIVAAGFNSSASTGEDFAMAVYSPDGTLDAGFDGDGRLTSDHFGNDDRIKGVVVQADGKIAVAGHGFKNDDFSVFFVARYNTDGTLDPGFGVGGEVVTDLPGDEERVFELAIQPDGRLVAGGRAGDALHDFALARYNTDGSLDTTFGVGGTVTTDFNGGDDEAVSLALQADGKIIAIGKSYKTQAESSRDWVIARYDANGMLDSGFGTDGKVIEDFAGGSDAANFGLLQPDGNLIVVGEVTQAGGGVDFGVMRFEGDPNPDFGVAITPETINVRKGQKGEIAVSISRLGGFTGDVTVTAPDTKPIKVKLTPPVVTASGDTATFNFKIKKKAAVGSYQLVFSGRDGAGRERTATVTLVVS